jgi:hypothetical protein
MKKKYLTSLIFILIITFTCWKNDLDSWKIEEHSGYTLYYTDRDKEDKKEYMNLIDNGFKNIQFFFDDTFKKKFEVFIHPDRLSLDKQWSHDWNIPDFKSECWMVASGVAGKLDILSPNSWIREACEHDSGDKIKTQQLIVHELVHVFHGQINLSPDFSDMKDMDWFVEGLAAYASGQCDANRIQEIKMAIVRKEIPLSLDNFWTGNLKYGLSGSMVMYIDNKFGRNKLRELLKFKSKTELLEFLKISEQNLLKGWEGYMNSKQIPNH